MMIPGPAGVRHLTTEANSTTASGLRHILGKLFKSTNESMLRSAVVLLALVAPLAIGRKLHPKQKKGDEELPYPWEYGEDEDVSATAKEDNTNDEPVALESAEAFPSSSGLQACPSNPNLTGYSSWQALVADVASNNSDARTEPFLLCPQFLYDGMGSPLTITHYFTHIQCADMSRTCVVTQASIMIADHLKNIRFEGIMFTNPRSALVVGKGTHAYFINSSISGAVFNEIEEFQAPIVSFGHLFVINSSFVGNIGHGAIWAVDDTLYVDQCKFQSNSAVSFRNSAAAIHIGSDTANAIVATTLTNNCFQGNLGYHIVFVEGADASVSWAAGNSVDAEMECPGITKAINATAGYCEPFDVQGIDTCDAVIIDDATTGQEEDGTDPGVSGDPLADAVDKVTFGVTSDTTTNMRTILVAVSTMVVTLLL